MAIKREDAQNTADRAAQQAINEGLRGGQEAADATRRMNETAAEQGKRDAADATRRMNEAAAEQGKRGAESAMDASRRVSETAAEQGKRGAESAMDATRRISGTAADQGKRGTESAMDATRNVAQFSREQAQRGAAAAEQGVKQAADVIGAAGKSYSEIAEQSRGNMEAAMQSSARIARGFQEMGWEVARFSQDTLRSGLRAASEMMHCRSIEDMVEVQSHFVQESLDRVLDQQTRILRLSRTTADEAEQAIVSHKHEGGEARPQ